MNLLSNVTFIDLTHTLTHTIPTWDGSCGFEHVVSHDYHEIGFRVQTVQQHAGIGTHLDAPAHCLPETKTVAQLSLEELITPCICINVSEKADEQFMLSANDVLAFEQQYNLIPANSLVIVYTGWSRFWNEPERYRNKLQFPSISPEAATLLVERNVAGIGIDTLSPDTGNSDFEVHKIILGANKYIVENIANAEQLPPTGSTTLVLPLKGEALTEAPVRLVGLIEKE